MNNHIYHSLCFFLSFPSPVFIFLLLLPVPHLAYSLSSFFTSSTSHVLPSSSVIPSSQLYPICSCLTHFPFCNFTFSTISLCHFLHSPLLEYYLLCLLFILPCPLLSHSALLCYVYFPILFLSPPSGVPLLTNITIFLNDIVDFVTLSFRTFLLVSFIFLLFTCFPCYVCFSICLRLE